MAGSNKKKVKQSFNGASKFIAPDRPDHFYDMHPSWRFRSIDQSRWSLSPDTAGELRWTELLPRLTGFESQTWSHLLVRDSKSNHLIQAERLNRVAERRLSELPVELEAIYSLRINGTHRLYGYIDDAVFHILWFDTDHGDNNQCVCRSHKRHT